MAWITAFGWILFLQLPSHQMPEFQRTPLYDAQGVAAGFIQFERFLFLWSGIPAAYLVRDTQGGHHIYGFDTGEHLGWYDDGTIRDRRGYRVGAIEEKHPGPLKPIPLHRSTLIYPRNRERKSAPPRPVFKDKWSYISLELFLQQGSIR